MNQRHEWVLVAYSLRAPGVLVLAVEGELLCAETRVLMSCAPALDSPLRPRPSTEPTICKHSRGKFLFANGFIISAT